MKPAAGALLLVLLANGGALLARAAETLESLHKKANAVLAQLEGEIKVPGLKEPVEVLRDRWGIPTSTRRVPRIYSSLRALSPPRIASSR